jgi:hypothetical protein
MQFELDPESPTISLSHSYEGMQKAIAAALGSLDDLLSNCQGDIIYGPTQSPVFVDVKPDLNELYITTVHAQCALDQLNTVFIEPYVNDASFLKHLSDSDGRAYWAEFESQYGAMNAAGLKDAPRDKSVDVSLVTVKTAWNSLLDSAQQVKTVDGAVTSTGGQNRTYIKMKDGRPVFLLPIVEKGDESVFSATSTGKDSVFEENSVNLLDLVNLAGSSRSELDVRLTEFIAQSQSERTAALSVVGAQYHGDHEVGQGVLEGKRNLLDSASALLAALENGLQMSVEGHGGSVDGVSLVPARSSDHESVITIGGQSFMVVTPGSALSLSKVDMESLEQDLKSLVSILRDYSQSDTQTADT